MVEICSTMITCSSLNRCFSAKVSKWQKCIGRTKTVWKKPTRKYSTIKWCVRTNACLAKVTDCCTHPQCGEPVEGSTAAWSMYHCGHHSQLGTTVSWDLHSECRDQASLREGPIDLTGLTQRQLGTECVPLTSCSGTGME